MHTMILDHHKEKMILGVPWTLLQLNYKLKRSFMMGPLSVNVWYLQVAFHKLTLQIH